MMFNGSRMSPELSSYLHALSPNYKCIDDWLGYRVYDEERFKKMNLRQFLHLKQKKCGPASSPCDRDHSMGRDDSHLILHATKSCTDGSHSSNIVHTYIRKEKNCHCLGTSRIQYLSVAEVAKMAADKLAEIKRTEKAADMRKMAEGKKAADERKRLEAEKRQANSKRKRLEEAEMKRLEEEKRLQANIAGIGISSNLMLEMVDKVTGLTTFSYSCTLNKDMAEKLFKLGLSGSINKYSKNAFTKIYQGGAIIPVCSNKSL